MKDKYTIKSKGESTRVKISCDYLSLDQAHKVCYKYLDEYHIEISETPGFTIIGLAPIQEPLEKAEGILLTKRLSNDLVEARTREIVHRETKNIRDLIIAKAFFHLSK
jgi:His-Xaa-Ser system protein HxsD